MADQPLNYAHITAATSKFIVRQDQRWHDAYVMNPGADAEPFRTLAMGAYMLWSELSGGNFKSSDDALLYRMVEGIGKPKGQ